MLEQDGYTVTVVGNGQQAAEAVERNDYEMVLMDVQMPVLNGLDAAALIRSRGEMADYCPDCIRHLRRRTAMPCGRDERSSCQSLSGVNICWPRCIRRWRRPVPVCGGGERRLTGAQHSLGAQQGSRVDPQRPNYRR